MLVCEVGDNDTFVTGTTTGESLKGDDFALMVGVIHIDMLAGQTFPTTVAVQTQSNQFSNELDDPHLFVCLFPVEFIGGRLSFCDCYSWII